jgi:hypothetical protein
MPTVCCRHYIKGKKTDIVQYHTPPKTGLSSVKMVELRTLKQPVVLPNILNANLIWHLAWFYRTPKTLRPNWSGYMQTICKESMEHQQLLIFFLALI